jgi:hypothetical protein
MQKPSLPPMALALDCETTTDATQRLLFGSWRVFLDGACIDEGIFYADDLQEKDLVTLRTYVASHRPATAKQMGERLRLLSRREFLNDVFWKVAYRQRALVIGFNLLFDLTRLASGWRVARKPLYTGGFSCWLWEYKRDGVWRENRFRPRIELKSIDSKRTLISFTRARSPDVVDLIPEGSSTGRPDPTYTFPGHFLDLRTLAFALTNTGHSLKSAGEAFGGAQGKGEALRHGVITPEYIDYNRQDVAATWALYEKLRTEYERHPITLPITKAYSPATIGKAYLAAMGIPPIQERQPDFPRDVLGYAMASYYGGRAERIRKVAVPVVYVDFLSMYPTVCALMNLWRLLTAQRIEVEDATVETQQLLATLTLEECFDQSRWPGFAGLVQIAPDGEVLPVRANYGGPAAWQIGVNPYTSSDAAWYTIPDVIASTLLTGKPPQVVRAIRFVPHGRVRGLRPTALRGQVPIDLKTTDFFRAVLEERYRVKARTELSDEEKKRLDAFLKVLANATSYGIFAEMNRQELPGRETATVSVFGGDETPFTTSVRAPEEPGSYFFSPVAACIAGAARLMLALLERCVTDRGGSYAMCDTDSMAIVATRDGGLIPCPGGAHRVHALTWSEVETIRDRFTLLNPYDATAIRGSILKLEQENFRVRDAQRARDVQCTRDAFPREGAKQADFPQEEVFPHDPCARMYDESVRTHDVRARMRELRARLQDHAGNNAGKTDTDKMVPCQLYCYAISAKRYVLFNVDVDGRPVLRKWSEHGLGHLLNPTDPKSDDRDWIRQYWEGIVTEALGQAYQWPDWLDRPAIGRITASSPEMLKPFTTWNRGKSYHNQVKPFNFLLTAFVASFGHPPGVDPAHFHLVAPYEADPRKWAKLPWTNLYDETGARYRITTFRSDHIAAGVVRDKTYRDVLDEYRAHAETKSLAPDGKECIGPTTGLLCRRPVTALYRMHVGKESNRLEAVDAGLIHDPEEVYTEYVDPQHDPEWEALVTTLKRIPRSWLMHETGLDRSTITRLRNGHTCPTVSTREKLLRAVTARHGRGE